MVSDGTLDQYAGETFVADFTLKDVFDIVGKETVKQVVIDKTSAASFNSAYEMTHENITSCWFFIFLIGAVFATLSVIAMEFVDNDKR